MSLTRTPQQLGISSPTPATVPSPIPTTNVAGSPPSVTGSVPPSATSSTPSNTNTNATTTADSDDNPLRSTSVPPDLELNSTNVFAFGLQSYSGFGNDLTDGSVPSIPSGPPGSGSVSVSGSGSGVGGLPLPLPLPLPGSLPVTDGSPSIKNTPMYPTHLPTQQPLQPQPTPEELQQLKAAGFYGGAGWNGSDAAVATALQQQAFALQQQVHAQQQQFHPQQQPFNAATLQQMGRNNGLPSDMPVTGLDQLVMPDGTSGLNPQMLSQLQQQQGSPADYYYYMNNLNAHGYPMPMTAPLQGMNQMQNVNYMNIQQTGNTSTSGNTLSHPHTRGSLNPSICKFYAQGHCARGEQCNYAHISPTKGTGFMMNTATAAATRGGRGIGDRGDRMFPTGKMDDRYGKKPGDMRFMRGGKYPMRGRGGYGAMGMGRGGFGAYGGYGYGAPDGMGMNGGMGKENMGLGVGGDMSGIGMEGQGLLPAPPSLNGIPGGYGPSGYGYDPQYHEFHDPSMGYGPNSDFLTKYSPNSTIEELQGNIYVIAKDQYGCRLLQRMLDEQKPKVVDIVFAEVFDHMNELMTDPFGNYLCQKLIEHCNDQQRLAVITKVAPDLVAISLNMHGTRAVQKLVETISTPKEVELVVGALRASVVTLIKDLNGNHVIQRCLHHLSSKDNQFIYDSVVRHCVSVATHKHGCCVLQRCIDYATLTQKRQLVQEIVNNSLELVQDAFGNYVVQYVLDLGEPPISHGIMANLLGNISSLSVQKFSSNVVEKCLELAGDKMRAKVIDELVNVERLPRLLQDPYANYVIQKALSVSKKAQFERLVTVIKPHLATLRNTSFGKRIQNKILKKFPDLQLSLEFGEMGMGINMTMQMGDEHGFIGGGHQQHQQQQHQLHDTHQLQQQGLSQHPQGQHPHHMHLQAAAVAAVQAQAQAQAQALAHGQVQGLSSDPSLLTESLQQLSLNQPFLSQSSSPHMHPQHHTPSLLPLTQGTPSSHPQRGLLPNNDLILNGSMSPHTTMSMGNANGIPSG